MNIDGLSTEELERSRAAWWDDTFTRLLLDAVPPDAATLIDVGCGLATAAHALLPSRSKLAYLGVDLDEERLAAAQATLTGTSYARRVTLRKASAVELPVPEAVAEVVLFVLTLQHLADVPRALSEARRALIPGGRVVAVEPDNLGVRFGFDGPLDEVSRAFADLCRAARARQIAAGAGDLALGPSLAHRFADAGLRPTLFRAHAVQTTREETLGDFLDRLAAIGDVVARPLPDAPERERFHAALSAEHERSRRGWSSHVVPCFVAVGLRPEAP
jgi:ubiquinone/menaquinone biosynthesis C-methylase UbiE